MNLFPMTQTAALALRLVDTKSSTVPMIEMTSFKPKYDFEIRSTRLDRCEPEEEGISSLLICDLIKKLSLDKTIKLHSITIARNGRILCEAAFGTQKLDIWKHSFSACKSVTSLAIGMLIDDGLLTLDEKIVSIFKNDVSPIVKMRLKDLCVEDLLTMRSTVTFSEGDSMVDANWIKAFLASPTKGSIGRTFKYNSLNTYMLSAIVTQKTGKTLSEFLKPRLFDPLGIKDFYWEKCPKGIDKGGWGLYIRPEDFIKIGTLVINEGVYNSKRLVSAEYIRLATAKHVDVALESDRYDYGYQIWVGKKSNTFLFNGMLGQNLIGFKNNGVVVIANAGNSEMFQKNNFFKYLEETFNRDFPEKIPKNTKEYKKLIDYTASLSLYNNLNHRKGFLEKLKDIFSRSEKAQRDHFKHLEAKTFSVVEGDSKAVGILPLIIQSVENCYSRGVKSISFSMTNEGKPQLLYRENDAEVLLPLGLETPEIFNLEYRKDNFLVASIVKFSTTEDDESVMVIRLDFLETPSTRIIKLYDLGDNTLSMVQSEIPGADFLVGLTDSFMTELSGKPLLGAVLEKFGADYIEYKIGKSFNSQLKLKLSE